MTGEKLDNIRKDLGWNKKELAKRLARTETTIQNYIKEKTKIPKAVEIAVLNFAEKGGVLVKEG